MAAASRDKRHNLLKECLKSLQTTVDYVHQYSDSKEEDFDILRQVAKGYAENETNNHKAQQGRDATAQHLDTLEGSCTDVNELYTKCLEEQQTNSSYLNHPIWLKINSVIEGKRADDESVMDIDMSDIEEENQSIEEGIVPSQFEPPIDPITKQIIKNPCKNKRCGHVYEYDSVMEHLKRIKQNRSKPRCLYIGCTNTNMNSSSIVKDRVLQAQIQNYLANNQDGGCSNESQDEDEVL